MKRPRWAVALSLFCAATVLFLVGRDLFVPQVRDTEVWLGFEIHGWAARLSAPIHWSIFAAGAWGFWSLRPWIWPWASVYAFYVAVSHLIWNLTSPSGGGLLAGLWQLGLFSVPAVALLWARPPREPRIQLRPARVDGAGSGRGRRSATPPSPPRVRVRHTPKITTR